MSAAVPKSLTTSWELKFFSDTNFKELREEIVPQKTVYTTALVLNVLFLLQEPYSGGCISSRSCQTIIIR